MPENVGNDGYRSSEVVVIRQYNPKTDSERVEQVENSCEVGPNGELSLHTHLLGDPICRIRNSPAYLMLVFYVHFILLTELKHSNKSTCVIF